MIGFFCETETKKLQNKQGKLSVWRVVDSLRKYDNISSAQVKGGWNKGPLLVFLNRQYARKSKKHPNERVIKCIAIPRDIMGVTRTRDEALIKKVFVPKQSLNSKSQ